MRGYEEIWFVVSSSAVEGWNFLHRGTESMDGWIQNLFEGHRLLVGLRAVTGSALPGAQVVRRETVVEREGKGNEVVRRGKDRPEVDPKAAKSPEELSPARPEGFRCVRQNYRIDRIWQATRPRELM